MKNSLRRGQYRRPEMYVGSVDKELCRKMVLKHHYSGRVPGIKFCWGLWIGSELVGCVVYSVPASYTLCKGVCGPEYKTNVLELSRLVIVTKRENAASLLVGTSLRELGRAESWVIVSYADCNQHVGHIGYVYQATNWLYTGHGNAEPLWQHPETGEVVSYTRRHIDDKARKFGLEWTDLVKIKQVGKHRYVTFAGNRCFKKQARAVLRYKVLPYPKGPTARHEECVMRRFLQG